MIKNNIIKTEQKSNTFSAFLSQDAIKTKINNMVGGKDGQRFITSILSAVSINPKLAECEKSTILSSALLGEALKLSPSPQLGQYYLVPYDNRKLGVKQAQFQLGYKGYIQLAIRSGQYKNINVVAIKKGELISYNPLTEELQTKFIEDDEIRENTETFGYYAIFELINGFTKSIYWSKKKMEQHANKYSTAFSLEDFKKIQTGKIPERDMWKYSSYWYKDFDGMAFKTLLRQLISKWGIMSIEMNEAFTKDMGVIKDDDNVDYIDNQEENNIQNDIINNQTGEVIESESSQDDLGEDF